ncbi:hypothetical protein VF14_35555 [Nostoc linckia z18]|uniref:Leucine rich repeat variant n=2 Tax=Nostoc linckia TaxID=92942 RepID=A0A9Q5Z5E1_NOSLI|nr:hypothetical protein [Nostoc linckia]PHK28526.1 hypothetical protein VF12_32620 [Nostoc linckia z15]PHK38960.1 hypothetical protein VF13_35165 [Nostoc linckia z16]PHJ53887.1 hypothetical protein VF02_37025 [Nostoc linckia z1]PHJ56302.1 hypothetical protein VF05_37420 [Nostoc linckia z3]PHJ56516.1 hypothetical protein VF03_37505 [Nostoc linckia z2]
MDNIIALTNNLTQAELIAADSSTEPEILRELALFTDQKTRQAVASNPNTPPDVLLKLGAEFPSEFLSNLIFPLLLLENPNLVAEIPLPTLRSILRLENVPIYILEQAADKADLEVQLALVKNVQTSKGVLNRLAQSRHSQVVDAARLHITYAGELTQKYEEKITQVIQGIIATSQVHTTSFTVLAQICPIPEFIVEYWVKDSHYRDRLCRKIAYSTATFPSILQQLAYHPDGYTKVGAVQNPNTPVETLRQLAREQDLGLLKIITRNPNIPSDILESLSQNPDQTVRIQVAQHPNTPLAVVKELVNDTDMHVANAATEVIREKQGEYITQTVRKNPKTPAHVLEKLLQKDPRTVCEHPNTPPEILLEFSQSVHREMRECVARNPNAPVSILENLADDESSNVCREVARNPHTPIRLLFKQLARDACVNGAIAYQMSTKKNGQYPEKDSILDILAEESTSPLETILQRLAQDGGEAARIFLARRFDLPADLLAQLADATEEKVREAVAQNINAPASSLEKLAQAPETKVREAVAQNPNTPITILEQLSNDKKYEVLVHIAQKNLSSETLELLANSKSDQVREKAMLNPSLSKQAIERILCGEYATDFLKLNPDFLSRHPDSLTLTLNHYAQSQFPLVNYIALQQPQISQDLLQEKSLAISWLERLAVAQNPAATQQIIIKLAQDSNQLVRATAKDRLQNLSQT